MAHFHTLEIVRHEAIAQDAVAIHLRVPDATAAEFIAEPGQHIVLRTLIGGEEHRRTYSLTAHGKERLLCIAVRIHEQGVFSKFLARDCRVGDALECLSPKGNLYREFEQTGAHHYVAFAAGCGITPIFSLVSHLLDNQPDASFTLAYGNRSGVRAMLLDDLFALKNRYPERFALHLLMSRETGEIELFNGRIDARWVERTANKLFPLDAAAYYLCGPGSMIPQVRETLIALGVVPTHIHAEHFSADTASEAASTASGNMESAPDRIETQIEVQIIESGRRRRFLMDSGNQTILEAGLESGLELPYACMGGVCCTCRAQLVAGQVDMLENYALEPDEVEAGAILLCQSLPLSDRIVISYDEP